MSSHFQAHYLNICWSLSLTRNILSMELKIWSENKTTKNTVISPNFLAWKFCEKTQFPHSFGRFTRNYPKTVLFPQNFHNRKLLVIFFSGKLRINLVFGNASEVFIVKVKYWCIIIVFSILTMQYLLEQKKYFRSWFPA